MTYKGCPWGSWDMDDNWYPNPNLEMSADEQFRQNVENGYIKVELNGEDDLQDKEQ